MFGCFRLYYEGLHECSLVVPCSVRPVVESYLYLFVSSFRLILICAFCSLVAFRSSFVIEFSRASISHFGV